MAVKKSHRRVSCHGNLTSPALAGERGSHQQAYTTLWDTIVAQQHQPMKLFGVFRTLP
jgi:hypothetical protein